MRSSTIIATIASALAVSASPVPVQKRAITDVDILQFALTLEHLENAFYSGFLAEFDDDAFVAAGFPTWVRGRLSQVAEHEAAHVSLLQAGLGSIATLPCNYSFAGVTDPASFVATSSVLENVGVSAYLGAAALIADPTYLTIAGSILTTEARHQGWVTSSGLHREGWSTPYDTPQQPSAIYSLAAQFITACPSTNPALPVKAFPIPTFDGTTGAISYPGLADGHYAALYQGLNQAIYPIVNGIVTIPTVQGIAYLQPLTTGNLSLAGDDTFAAGPVIIDNGFSSKVSNPTSAI